MHLIFIATQWKPNEKKNLNTHKKNTTTQIANQPNSPMDRTVCVCVCALFSSVVRQLPKNLEFDVTRTMLKHGNLFVVVIENGLLSGPNVCVDR